MTATWIGNRILDARPLHWCTNVHTMDPCYERDAGNAVANIAKHGVDFADAIAVFDDPLAVTIPDPDAAGESRFITLGQDASGRSLVVVYAESADLIRIISARRATRRERRNHAI